MRGKERKHRPPYETPVVVPLGGLARGTGYCAPGSAADVGYCTAGTAAASACTAGGIAVEAACTAGTIPGA